MDGYGISFNFMRIIHLYAKHNVRTRCGSGLPRPAFTDMGWVLLLYAKLEVMSNIGRSDLEATR